MEQDNYYLRRERWRQMLDTDTRNRFTTRVGG